MVGLEYQNILDEAFSDGSAKHSFSENGKLFFVTVKNDNQKLISILDVISDGMNRLQIPLDKRTDRLTLTPTPCFDVDGYKIYPSQTHKSIRNGISTYYFRYIPKR